MKKNLEKFVATLPSEELDLLGECLQDCISEKKKIQKEWRKYHKSCKRIFHRWLKRLRREMYEKKKRELKQMRNLPKKIVAPTITVTATTIVPRVKKVVKPRIPRRKKKLLNR